MRFQHRPSQWTWEMSSKMRKGNLDVPRRSIHNDLCTMEVDHQANASWVFNPQPKWLFPLWCLARTEAAILSLHFARSLFAPDVRESCPRQDSQPMTAALSSFWSSMEPLLISTCHERLTPRATFNSWISHCSWQHGAADCCHPSNDFRLSVLLVVEMDTKGFCDSLETAYVSLFVFESEWWHLQTN